MNLPIDFANRMKQTLGDEYDDFLASYDTPRAYGLRRNPIKVSKDVFEKIVNLEMEPIPWCSTGYYYNEEDRPGKNALHEAGAYYIQEPSAMSVVDLLGIEPGDRVLDLCAAPGGKSTQAAGFLLGTGVIVSNEIVPKRARILSQNIERMGISNCVVTNMTPDELEIHFRGFFDKIIVDAPCSGEGMFNKEDAALTEWSLENVAMCASRQQDILRCAIEMLRVGGTLIYSTCTFSEEENEKNVLWITKEYPQMQVDLIDAGIAGISEGYGDIIPGCARIWPHKQKGEGHFVARLKKGKAEPAIKTTESRHSFRKVAFGENMYLYPEVLPNPKGMRIERPGLHIWTDLKNRKEPAHALAMALCKSGADGQYSLGYNDGVSSADDKSIIDEILREIGIDEIRFVSTDRPDKYLAGESINCEADIKGWCIVTYKDVSLGWGKASGGIVKNHYPKGLRKQIQL